MAAYTISIRARSHQLLLLVLMAMALATMLFSCKHGDNNASPDFGQGTGHCRLITIGHPNYPYYGTTQLTYDTAGRLSIVTKTGVGSPLTTFSYHDSIVIANYSNGTTTTFRDSIVLNGHGQISYDAAGFVPPFDYERRFTYDDQNQLTHFSVKYFGTPNGDRYFMWNNGNMITDSFGIGNTLTYTYTDLPFQYASQQQLSDFLQYSIPLWKPRQLPSYSNTTTVAGTVQHFYSFDQEGKVKSDSLYNTSTKSGYMTTFTYECK